MCQSFSPNGLFLCIACKLSKASFCRPCSSMEIKYFYITLSRSLTALMTSRAWLSNAMNKLYITHSPGGCNFLFLVF